MSLSDFIIFMGVLITSVNAQGVVGGSPDNNQEECIACLKGVCQSVNGIYMRPDLPPGYSLVTQLPKGACGVLVQQLKHTRNYLAMKYSNGSYILNGDWKFSNSKAFHVAGTRFHYVKQDSLSLETISASGPLHHPVDILVVNYQANPGIKYVYSLPTDNLPVIAPPLLKRPSKEPTSIETRRLDPNTANSTIIDNQKDEARPVVSRRTRLRRKYFHWKVTGLTPCSVTCGGGTQTYIRTCMRQINPQHQIPVHERRCAHLDSSTLAPIPCNIDSCPVGQLGSWDGFWSQCSVSCGEGIQQFIPQCKQTIDGRLVVVSEVLCQSPKPSGQTRRCQESECEAPRTAANEIDRSKNSLFEWTVGAWSSCSVSCGTGHKTRSVVCPSGQCHPEKRPAHADYCKSGPCDTLSVSPSASPISSSHDNENSQFSWMTTEWTHCSEHCGTGNQTRFALCVDNSCSLDSKPETVRACSSEKHCDGKWFAGPWNECSDSCSGVAKQRREVLCVAKIRGVSHITNEMTCSIALKPSEEQLCHGICLPHWYMGEWGKCEGACPTGIQRREVQCMNLDKTFSDECREDDKPITKRPCSCEETIREHSRDLYAPAHDEPVDRSCVDKISKCRLAVRARLCHYPYYTKYCCESCKKSQQDFL